MRLSKTIVYSSVVLFVALFERSEGSNAENAPRNERAQNAQGTDNAGRANALARANKHVGIAGAHITFNETSLDRFTPCEKGRIIYALQEGFIESIDTGREMYEDRVFQLSGDGFDGEYETCDTTKSSIDETATWPFPPPPQLCERLQNCTVDDDDVARGRVQRGTRRRLSNSCDTICCTCNCCSKKKYRACMSGGCDRRRLDDWFHTEMTRKLEPADVCDEEFVQNNCPEMTPNEGYRRLCRVEERIMKRLGQIFKRMHIPHLGPPEYAVECVVVTESTDVEFYGSSSRLGS